MRSLITSSGVLRPLTWISVTSQSATSRSASPISRDTGTAGTSFFTGPAGVAAGGSVEPITGLKLSARQ